MQAYTDRAMTFSTFVTLNYNLNVQEPVCFCGVKMIVCEREEVDQ